MAVAGGKARAAKKVGRLEALRFLGWHSRLVVVEVVQGEGAASALSPGTADMAVSYDSVFEWEKRFEGGNQLKVLHRALKKGGTLGIVERRAAQGSSFRSMMQEGAVTEEHVILLAEVAGFRLVTRSGADAQGHMLLKFVKP